MTEGGSGMGFSLKYRRAKREEEKIVTNKLERLCIL